MPNGAMVEGQSAEKRAKHKSWRAAVADAARAAVESHGLVEPMDGALHLDVTFRFQVTKGRLRQCQQAGSLPKVSAPDLDKLLRALGDALKDGGLVRDDARFASIAATKVEVDGWQGAVVSVERWGLWP